MIRYTSNKIGQYVQGANPNISRFTELSKICYMATEQYKKPFDKELLKEIKEPLMRFKLVYAKVFNTKKFCLESLHLGHKIYDKGHPELADILFSEVFKTADEEIMISDKFLDAVKKSIEINKQRNDKIHLVSRLGYLEKIYKAKNDMGMYYKTLRDKLLVLDEILTDYQKAASNFHSLDKPAPEKESMLKTLRYTNNDFRQFSQKKKY